jgi:antitoxin component YwqK of YwqJK toxin-antitoxin module
MKWIFAIFPLFFIRCQSKTETPNKLRTGIYLKADSLTPGALKFTVDKPPGKIYYVDTTCLLDENDFQKLIITEHSISFRIELTDQGNLRYTAFANKFAGKWVDVIVENHLIGSYFLYSEWGEHFSSNEISRVAMEEGLLADELWARNMADSLNKVWNARPEQNPPADGMWKIYYANGKIFREEEYKKGELQSSKKYFENRNLAYSYLRKDTMIGKDAVREISKAYYFSGKLFSETYSDGLFCTLLRTYFENGKVKHETIGTNGFYTGPEFVRDYDKNGNLVYESHSTYPDQLPCGDKGEFNHPRVYHEKYFENNSLIEESEFYADCGECESDTSGVWKFYKNGKLIRNEKYPSWQERYKKACSGGGD